MTNLLKTDGVKSLVEDALRSLPSTSSPDVIDATFKAIEDNPDWHAKYDELVAELGRDVVNQWGGRWISESLGRAALRQVEAKLSTLIESYSQLSN